GREVEAAAHAAGVGADEAVGGLRKVERREKLSRPLTRMTAAEVVEAADHFEGLGAGQGLVHRGVLARQAGSLAHVRGITDDIEARDTGRAFVGRQQGGQDSHRRRLACPIRAEQPKNSARLDAQVYTTKGVNIAVAFAEPGCLDGEISQQSGPTQRPPWSVAYAEVSGTGRHP